MKFIRDILTSDAQSSVYDLTRVITLAAFLSFVAFQAVALFRNQPFAAQDFGLAVGIIIAAGAGGMWARKDVEHG